MVSDAVRSNGITAANQSYPNVWDSLQNSWYGRTVICLSLALGIGVVILGVVEIIMIIQKAIEERYWKPTLEEIKNAIQGKFSDSFIEKINRFPPEECLKYSRLLIKCTEDELIILNALDNHFQLSPHQLNEIFKGAHVRLDDGGQFYAEWKQTVKQKRVRPSSHKADDIQYSITGPFSKQFLFSRLTVDAKTYTWLQFEKNPWAIGYLFRHLVDYLKYKFTGQNQGPYGSSSYTDKVPLILYSKNTV